MYFFSDGLQRSYRTLKKLSSKVDSALLWAAKTSLACCYDVVASYIPSFVGPLLEKVRIALGHVEDLVHCCGLYSNPFLFRGIVPGIRQALFSLSLVENAKDKARRGLRVLKSFLNGLRISINDIELGLSIDPETGTADSGDIEADMPQLMLALGEAAAASREPVAIFVDANSD